MVRALGAETLNASFFKTDSTGWMEFIVVQHSVTSSGQLNTVICILKVCSQGQSYMKKYVQYFCIYFFKVSYAKSLYFCSSIKLLFCVDRYEDFFIFIYYPFLALHASFFLVPLFKICIEHFDSSQFFLMLHTVLYT